MEGEDRGAHGDEENRRRHGDWIVSPHREDKHHAREREGSQGQGHAPSARAELPREGHLQCASHFAFASSISSLPSIAFLRPS